MNIKQHSSILLIADDPGTRQLVNDILSGAGFSVEYSESADMGIDKSIDLLPSVILVEDSANINGYDVCHRLRAKQVLDGIPVVMLMDANDPDSLAMGLSSGADDFIEKPLDSLQVLARLRSLIRFNSDRYLLNDLTRFSWMAEFAHEGYLMLDKSGAIHYANERALHLLNMPDDFFGLPFINVVERQYLPEPVESWKSWSEDPSPCFLIQPESPTARAVWLVLEALEPPKGVDFMRIVRLRDVTERMTIYQDMRRFHTVVAHKLRTPMSMLMMSMNILKNQMDHLSPEEIKESIGTAIKGTDRLADEVRLILSYLDAPLALNLGAPLKLIDLPGLVENLCKTLHLDNVDFSMPDNLQSTQIAMTPDAVDMILLELMENSRKFHPEHKPNIQVSIGQPDEDFIQIRFTDNGVSLSAEQLQWAWLPYFQGEKDFTGELPGLGLGFPMVATLVWKSGGVINLRNRSDGPGVIVDIKIPLESTSRKIERSASPFGS